MVGVARRSVRERIESKVSIVPITGCWLWMGALMRSGYGRVGGGPGRGTKFAHRVAYEEWRGPIPPGLTIDHLCRNTWCVNPAHLEPVTMRENTMRSSNFAAMHARQTHCKHGHAFDSANTYRALRTNERKCRECGRIRALARRHMLKARAALSIGA